MSPERLVYLVHPSTGSEAPNASSLAGSEHLGLSYLAAALMDAGAEVRVFDLQRNPEAQVDFLTGIAAEHPPVVGLSPTSRSFGEASRLVREVRGSNPEALIIIGGHLATALRERTFELIPEIDVVVCGNGEQLIVPLLDHALTREVPDFPEVRLNSDSKFTREPAVRRPGKPWTELFPHRGGSAEFYRSRGVRMLSSLGCLYDCAFCTTPYFSGRRIQERSVEHIASEAQLLATGRGIDRVWFNDDLFITGAPRSIRRGVKIAASLAEVAEGLRFRAMVRADTFRNNIPALDELVSYGMDTVFVGIESGDNAALLTLNKRATVDINRWIAEVLEERGVLLQPGFILYTPDQSQPGLVKSVRFLQQIGELYRFFPLTRSVSIFPGATLWTTTEKTGQWDRERSTSVERYPIFGDPAVRTLAIAYEDVEKRLSALDSRLYRARGQRLLTRETRALLGELIGDIFAESMGMVAAGATAPQIADMVEDRSAEVAALADDLAIAR